MDPLPLVFFAGVLSVVAAIGAWQWWFSSKRVVTRRLQQTPTTRIAQVRDGSTAKVVGTLAYCGEPLRAPFSGRKCAYYEVRVEEHRGKNSWATVASESAGGQFMLEDDTGKALISLADLSTAVVEDMTVNAGFLNDPPPALQRFLEQQGQSTTGMLGFNKTLRFYEGVLERGERVAVYGTGQWETDPDPRGAVDGYRGTPKRLRMTSPPDGPMLVSDEPSVTQ